jgi:tetratricopeptide (TPR) repeat protein
VELAAVQVGSVWQVETWEAPALILVYTLLADIVAATRVAHRLELMSRTVPALRPYSHLAKQGLMLARGETALYTELVAEEYSRHEPRSYIGWAATMAYLVNAYNRQGRFAEAKAVSDRTLAHVTDADREYASLFLNVDLQAAIAEAGLGRTEEALARLDALLLRFRDTDHALALGLLHEARARIAWGADRKAEYDRSLVEVERWFRPTKNPVLVAKYEQLARLRSASIDRGPKRDTEDAMPTVVEVAVGDSTTASLTGEHLRRARHDNVV